MEPGDGIIRRFIYDLLNRPGPYEDGATSRTIDS